MVWGERVTDVMSVRWYAMVTDGMCANLRASSGWAITKPDSRVDRETGRHECRSCPGRLCHDMLACRPVPTHASL